MKATIRADGMLVVQPESDLDAYALSRWSAENLKIDWYDAGRVRGHPIIVDLSGYNVLIGALPVGHRS
ncbi:hypothetical protein BX589_101244 [Paraburkholderia fungorum]|uniref:hypothetical protein n=1 Tax=Paraburkholderia fungorum TaxID=134537 RepID=UPI000D050A06|nr:hypothetical protein [Paraburkholderia fungorum]PRZ56594.1 hypothetical protein BX589_101244 [Paraburkholderia fungorum]